jgi:hypothetical protein
VAKVKKMNRICLAIVYTVNHKTETEPSPGIFLLKKKNTLNKQETLMFFTVNGKEFEGQVAIITGAASGIGLAISHKL